MMRISNGGGGGSSSVGGGSGCGSGCGSVWLNSSKLWVAPLHAPTYQGGAVVCTRDPPCIPLPNADGAIERRTKRLGLVVEVSLLLGTTTTSDVMV